MSKICETCGQRIYSKRSLEQNRLYWEIITFIWMHQKNTVWARPYNLHQTIKMCIGYTEPILNSKGKQIGTTLKSTNFKEMSQKDFNEYFDLVQDFIWSKIVLLHDEEFERELSQLMGVFK